MGFTLDLEQFHYVCDIVPQKDKKRQVERVFASEELQ